MKHLKLNEAYFSGGFYVFDDILEKFKDHYSACADIAYEHHYTIIQELNDTSSMWSVTMVLQSNLYPNVTEFSGKSGTEEIEVVKMLEQWHGFYQEIDDLRPTETKYFGKRFLCHADIKRYDISQWEISKKLKRLDQATGIFSTDEVKPARFPEFVSVKVWMDF